MSESKHTPGPWRIEAGEMIAGGVIGILYGWEKALFVDDADGYDAEHLLRRPHRPDEHGDSDEPWSIQWGTRDSWAAPVEVSDDEAACRLFAARAFVNRSRR